MKNHPITLDKPRVLHYGIIEMRDCSRITGKDPLRNGEHWIAGMNVDNIALLAMVLLKRDDPTITVQQIETLIEENPDKVTTDLATAFCALVKPDEVPQEPTPTQDMTPSGGLSADSTLDSVPTRLN